MENGKSLLTCLMSIMPKDLVQVMRSIPRPRDLSSACTQGLPAPILTPTTHHPVCRNITLSGYWPTHMKRVSILTVSSYQLPAVVTWLLNIPTQWAMLHIHHQLLTIMDLLLLPLWLLERRNRNMTEFIDSQS